MKNALLLLALLGILQFSYARPPKGQKKSNTVTYRDDCVPGNSGIDLDVNNVRARLLSRGDMWWDYNDPIYEVPKGGGVSSIFAGAIWVGGLDEIGNLKLALTDYAGSGQTDYYPGPLDLETGDTEFDVCQNWDKHFVVYGSEIAQFLVDWNMALQNGTDIADELIPDNLKTYPARGNPYFELMPNGFILPDQQLAPYFDNNMDGMYNPMDGDYPVLGIHGCSNTMNYADQMVFQIFNDMGPHQSSGGVSIGLEFQVQSFAFSTEDQLNDMTFYKYKLVHRSQDTLSEVFFSLWMDVDLGCSEDDYVGCDTARSLVYYYNKDSIDGPCSFENTYGANIPIFGIDLLQGPLDDEGNELKMSSFVYFNRATGSTPNGTTDPVNGMEYTNYAHGLWKDGSPMYAGGDGYGDTQYSITQFAFYDEPDDVSGWSMAQENLKSNDRRTLLNSGSFTLNPGSTKEIIYGLPWVPNVPHPAPSLSTLLAADDKAQALFDDCFTNVTATETPLIADLAVFPNPASNYIRIQSTENIATVQLQLISMSGQVVLSQKATQNASISISHLPQGIYGYKVMDLKGQLLGAGKLSKN